MLIPLVLWLHALINRQFAAPGPENPLRTHVYVRTTIAQMAMFDAASSQTAR
jgi:hypothetical protein